MKVDEDWFDRDRDVAFQTDDEENQAETFCPTDDDDDEDEIGTDSDVSSQSCGPTDPILSLDSNGSAPWPRSYKESMDIYTNMASPSIELLKRASFSGITASFLSRRTPSQLEGGGVITPSTNNNSLTRPLISSHEQVTPTFPGLKLSSNSNIQLLQPPSTSTSKKSTFAQAVFNGINILCGIGLLATPYAVAQGGWLSLLILALFCIVGCYTGILLQRCLDSAPGLHTYPDIGQAAFGIAGRIGLAMVFFTELYAASVEFVVMMGDNLASIFPNTHCHIPGIPSLTAEQTFAIFSTLVVLPTVWLRNLSLLSYVSAGGVVASLLVILCLLWIGVFDQIGFHHLDDGKLLDISRLPVTVGLYAFCFSGHSAFPNIYSSMKTPSQFPSVLVTSFGICLIVYAGAAACAFLMFGESIESQLTLNMPPKLVASQIAVWSTIVSPVSKYALTITPVALSLEELLPSRQLLKHPVIIPIFLRTILVISTLVVALTFDQFALIMALLGSSFATLLTFIFPCACYLSIFQGKLTKLQIALCISIITMGVFSAVIGTYSVIFKVSVRLDVLPMHLFV